MTQAAMKKAKTGEVTNLERSEIEKMYLDGRPYIKDEVVEAMASCLVSIQHSYINLGRYALAVKEAEGHGEFEKIIKEKFERPGFCSLRTVYNAMSVARFALSMTKNEKFSFFTDLPKCKQLTC